MLAFYFFICWCSYNRSLYIIDNSGKFNTSLAYLLYISNGSFWEDA
ncbi:hypothetical protein AHMF7616_02372 [Adhaeribacter pallidiroseus]|uniref:Uncharacterized protein n=1 Tax=Adhaeribacter pallidiroseus TaxID=2072847 RepID=A0A369QGC6_9BACT|nr:hypothetical protein AHMF7616_02372 [Adhaeribacter pallidiroseus]